MPAPLRIAFDATILATPWTGVARSFAVALADYARRNADRELLLLTGGEPWPADTDPADAATLDVLRAQPSVAVRSGPLRRRLGWRSVLTRQRIDLLHAPIAAIPLGAPCPVIATVHDLPWRAAVQLAEPSVGWRHRLAVRTAARHAQAIITPSTHTAADLRTWLRAPPKARLAVIPHGLEYAWPATTPVPRDGPFLAIGDDRPRKNFDRLRRAHRQATTADPTLPPLRFLGAAGNGHVDETTKRDLLSHATALVMPSLHEGFGIPVLEAFAVGTPVVASRAASLPEVAGAAAAYFDPLDADELARRLLAVHAEPGFAEQLRSAGRRRIERFSASATAAAWRQLHDRLLT